jgi:ribose-phosphate pyrophosphokinase
MDWHVAPGPASTDLGLSLARRLKAEVVGVDVKVFPDGESKVRITTAVRNKPVIVVQSTYPPVDQHLMQLFLLAHRLSEEGAEVYGLLPYFAYSRQDKEFLPGEVISLGVVVHLLRASGVKRLVTVDMHDAEGLGFFSFPAYSVSAIPQLAEYFQRNHKLVDAVAVSPDFGASARVEAFAKVLGCEYAVLEKHRNRVTGEIRTTAGELPVKGRDVVVVDDIISTGGTVQKAAQLLREAGAEAILATCVHPLLVGDASERLRRAGVRELVGTNTVPSPVSIIDVAPVLAAYFAAF